MTPVNWTPEARSRLEDIEAYIAKDSPAAAQEMVQRILGRTRQLEIAPRWGRPVPDYQQEDLRELLERPYRIIYRVGAERIAILTVGRISGTRMPNQNGISTFTGTEPNSSVTPCAIEIPQPGRPP
jgi:toxin ParE1/3/4